MAARAVSLGLPPPGWTAGPLACPLLPPEVPSSAPWFIPSLHETLSSSSPSGTTNSAICSHIQASGSLPLMSSFASDQVIPFSVPRAASLQSLGHPILFDWPPHLSHQVIPLWAGGPWLSHCGTIPFPGSRPISACIYTAHQPVGLSSFGQLMALDPALSRCILNDLICLSQPCLYHDAICHRVSSMSSHKAAVSSHCSHPHWLTLPWSVSCPTVRSS